MTDEMRGAMRKALVLAIARYVNAHPSAGKRAQDWLDDDERSLLAKSAGDLEAKASHELESLERWVAHAREDRDAWESVRVNAVQARLTLQSARTGSFESATGPLADFLRDVGETPKTLDIH